MKGLSISEYPYPSFSIVIVATTSSHFYLVSSYCLICCPEDLNLSCFYLFIIFKEPIHSNLFYDAKWLHLQLHNRTLWAYLSLVLWNQTAILIFKLVPEHQNHWLLPVFRICIFKEYGLSPSVKIHYHLLLDILCLRIFCLILFIFISLIFLNCFFSSYFYRCLNYFTNSYHSNSFCFILDFD